jgi:hypothetical protein
MGRLSHMKKTPQFVFNSGCLVSVLAPVIGFVLYPRAKWLFAFVLVGYDVDDYEHLNPKDPRLRELWRKSMVVGGLPEEWVRLDEAKKNELRDIIRSLRQLGVSA